MNNDYTMDSVFDNCTEQDLEFDTIFDQEDECIDSVVGCDKNGTPKTESCQGLNIDEMLTKLAAPEGSEKHALDDFTTDGKWKLADPDNSKYAELDSDLKDGKGVYAGYGGGLNGDENGERFNMDGGYYNHPEDCTCPECRAKKKLDECNVTIGGSKVYSAFAADSDAPHKDIELELMDTDLDDNDEPVEEDDDFEDDTMPSGLEVNEDDDIEVKLNNDDDDAYGEAAKPKATKKKDIEVELNTDADSDIETVDDNNAKVSNLDYDPSEDEDLINQVENEAFSLF